MSKMTDVKNFLFSGIRLPFRSRFDRERLTFNECDGDETQDLSSSRIDVEEISCL